MQSLRSLPGEIASIINPRLERIVSSIRGPDGDEVDPTEESTVIVNQDMYASRERPDPYIYNLVTKQIDPKRFKALVQEYTFVETAMQFFRKNDARCYTILLAMLRGKIRVNPRRLAIFTQFVIGRGAGPSRLAQVCASSNAQSSAMLTRVCKR